MKQAYSFNNKLIINIIKKSIRSFQIKLFLYNNLLLGLKDYLLYSFFDFDLTKILLLTNLKVDFKEKRMQNAS